MGEAPSVADTAAWHARPGALARFVGDLIADEVARLRPGGAALPTPPWAEELPIGEGGLGLDSLERLTVASALNEALHIHESGVEDLLLARHTFGGWLEISREALQHFDSLLTFCTSGSSGTPKACSHSLATLEQEIDYLATLFGDTRRVLVAAPAHHIYGFLFTVLLPARLNGAEVLDVRRYTVQALRQVLRAGDLLISHPAHWSVIARYALAFPAGVVGVTSTAPCPDELARALAAQGLARLLQVYGSSETAGVGWRDAPATPYRLMPFWARDAADDARLLRTAPDGATSACSVQDRLEWSPDSRFRVFGRCDNAVQVGGINVFPARVREVLLEHPAVADASVRLMSGNEGARLKAFIVAAPEVDCEALRTELESWMVNRLAVPERPKSLVFGERLPVNEQGKLADWPVMAPYCENLTA